ncbi:MULTISPECIES: hypothetical protein [Streptomyces]|uniref:hypothetical protein n=1 Tax=Streptomyces TaxID=1883 RepID=UPI00063FE8D1|nr:MULTISPECIES: hypothetical protein [Streptomyces]OLO25500.1 hypothetical protein PZ61_0238125 [Streptomyces sp. MNU77]
MTCLSILTFAPAPSPATVISIAAFAADAAAEAAYVSPPAPMLLGSIPTGAGADVHVYQDSDGSLSSDCTGCGEYAWTLLVTPEFAQEHAAACLRPPRRRAA